jgi:deferrochelatase/peroxidase EfeB
LNKIHIGRLQEGINYQKKPFSARHNPKKNDPLNDTFVIIFLRFCTRSAKEVERGIAGLWEMYQDLKMGYSSELENSSFPSGGLKVLLSYGERVFGLPGIVKIIPRDFKHRQFSPPGPNKHIVQGCGIRYSKDIYENVGLSEDVAIQLISNTNIGALRALVETKKYLQKSEKQVLKLSKFYTGFQRDDGRSWLGFHDEVSNLTTARERRSAIAIDPHNNDLLPRDYWTKNGTYLAYLRAEVDLDTWSALERSHQELIIGRDKLTGSPLVGVDIYGNPIVDEKSPSAYQIVGFEKTFHDHPNYFRVPKVSNYINSRLDLRASSEVLSQSHIGRARHMDNIPSKNSLSRRIFRQGFEFLEPVYNNSRKKFRVGLNFVSFQNDPSRLFFVLSSPDWMGNSNFGGPTSDRKIRKLISVLAAGIFFVPPHETPFPGSSMF